MGRVIPLRPSIARRGVSAFACGVVLLGAVALNQSAVHWRTDRADSDLFVYFGWCIAAGARPYLGVWDNKPPGIWWLNAAATRLCGSGLGAELLLGSAALLCALVAVVGSARQAYRRSLLVPAAFVAATLLADVRFEGGGDRTETFVIACETLGVCAYLRWLRVKHPAWLTTSGLALGVAPLFKQSGVAAAAACALHLAWVQWRGRGDVASRSQRDSIWRPWLVAGGAYIVPLLLAAGVLAWQGALGEAFFAVGRFNRAYFLVQDATWFRLDQAIVHYAPALRILAGVLAISGLGLAWGVVGRSMHQRGVGPAGRPRRGYGLFVLWFLLAAYLALVGPGRRNYHVLPALPPLALLAVYPLHLLAGRRGLQVRLIAQPRAVAGLVVYVYVLAVSVAGDVAAWQGCWRSKPDPWALRTAETSGFELQAAQIDRLAGPDETIYVWGWSPGTYRYARRMPASRYTTFEKLGQVAPYADFFFERGTADLRRCPPRVIVISIRDYAGLVTAPAGEFGTWLAAAYELDSTIGGMHILARR